MAQPGNEQGSIPQNQILAAYQGWQERTGYATRFFVLLVIVLTLLSFVLIDFTIYFSNIPAFSILHLEIYRLLLSPFVKNSIFSLIMMLFFFPTMGTQMEQQMGSAAFGGLIMTFTIVTNVLFAVLCIFLSMFGMPEALLWDCSGFWTVIFSLITVDCMKTPDVPRKMMCLPWEIPGKYFPLALYAFFSLFGGFELSYAMAIATGYAYSQGHLEKVKLTEPYLESLEETNGLLGSTAREATGWIFTVPQDGSGGYAPVNAQDSASSSSSSSFYPMNRGGVPSGAGAGNSIAAGSTHGKHGEQFPGRGSQLASAGMFGGSKVSEEEIKAKRLANFTKGTENV